MSLLTVTNLEKAYTSPEGCTSRIINVPHFEIDAGKQIALRGSSGAGKTTFLNLIAGILQADRRTHRSRWRGDDCSLRI